jgi:hypothetical protein
MRPLPIPTLVALLVLSACGGGEVRVGNGKVDGGAAGGGPSDSGSFQGGGDGGTAGPGGGSGTDGGAVKPDGGCGVARASGTLSRQAVDVVLVIDNSGSMGDEIQAVQDTLNAHFAEVLTDAGVDWRLVLLGKHGPAVPDESICISVPLSGNATCSPPPAVPANTARFFHYSVEVGSSNAWPLILSTFAAPDPSGAADGGWQQWLRPGAFKALMVMTDDDPSWSASSFDAQLVALSPQHFGSTAKRNYRFHSVVGVTTPSQGALQGAWPPSEPMVTTKCPTAVNTGDPYQELSRMTGGLRLSICDASAYAHLFEVLAGDVAASTGLQCDFEVPPPPPGYQGSDRIYVEVTPGAGGPASTLTQVTDAASCGEGRFHVAGGRVRLCDAACNALQADTGAAVEVLFTCEPLLQ